MYVEYFLDLVNYLVNMKSRRTIVINFCLADDFFVSVVKLYFGLLSVLSFPKETDTVI